MRFCYVSLSLYALTLAPAALALDKQILEPSDPVCQTCQSTGEFASGTIPASGGPVSSNAFDCNGGAASNPDSTDTAGASAQILSGFGIDPASLCTAGDCAEGEKCLPTAIINSGRDGVEFSKTSVPNNGVNGDDGYYCVYHASVSNADKGVKFKAHDCACKKSE